MRTSPKVSPSLRSLMLVPPVRLRVELSETLGYMNLIAYHLPDDKLMGSLSIDSGEFSDRTDEFNKTPICRALSLALRNHCMIDDGYVQILRDHENWFVVRDRVNHYLQEGERVI